MALTLPTLTNLPILFSVFRSPTNQPCLPMPSIGSKDAWIFLLRRIKERLWVKPLLICVVSVIAVFGAKVSDDLPLADQVPDVTAASVEGLLAIMAASMLAIATFAVTSMVSAYSSASSNATPRSFALVISDDVSQNALSSFVGAFIFSIVALTAMKNGYFEIAARFTLFCMTMAVFGLVIFTFVRWTDRIARLGRLGSTIDLVERATAAVMRRRRLAPTLGARLLTGRPLEGGQTVYSATIGYVQQISVAQLQACAEHCGGHIVVNALPGTFAMPGRPLAYVVPGAQTPQAPDLERVVSAFTIGGDRVFDHDPRFGLVVLSEIAGRALSPAVNDPGTAIDIVGTLVRLFGLWVQQDEDLAAKPVEFDRVYAPALQVADMFDDAFTAIARDGASSVEVCVRLQKSLQSLTLCGNAPMREAALQHAALALARAELALVLPQDREAVRAVARFAQVGSETL